jgi:hypothetical protein
MIGTYGFLILFAIPLIVPSHKILWYFFGALMALSIAWLFLSAASGLAAGYSLYFAGFIYTSIFVAGGLIRWLTSRFAKPRERPALFAFFVIVGFTSAFTLANGSSATYNWATGKSLELCGASIVPITIGTQRLNLSSQIKEQNPLTGMALYFHERERQSKSLYQRCGDMWNKKTFANDAQLTIELRNGIADDCRNFENNQISTLCKINNRWRKDENASNMSAVIFSKNWDYPELRPAGVAHKPVDYPASFNTNYALNCTPNSVDTQCEAYGTMRSGLRYVIDFRARPGAESEQGLRNLNIVNDILQTLSALD